MISVIAVAIMCYGNLRGIREAGRAFALPTYLFSVSVGLTIIVGLIREVTVGLPPRHRPGRRLLTLGHSTAGLFSFAMIYMLARSFANGGSSLTGIEAVSNAVSALRPPEGRNARQILVTQGSIVAFLIARHLLAVARHARDPVRGRLPDGARAGGERRLRQLRAFHVLRGPGGDRADPVHRW